MKMEKEKSPIDLLSEKEKAFFLENINLDQKRAVLEGEIVCSFVQATDFLGFHSEEEREPGWG